MLRFFVVSNGVFACHYAQSARMMSEKRIDGDLIQFIYNAKSIENACCRLGV